MIYILSIMAVLMASISQIILKSSSNDSHSSFIKDYFNVKVILGYSIMGFSMLLNIYAMHIGLQIKELSVIESLNYLFIPILAFIFFKEKVSIRQTVAIAIMLIGMFVFFC